MIPYLFLAIVAVVANLSTSRATPRLPGFIAALVMGGFVALALYLLALQMHPAVALAVTIIVLMTFIPAVAALLAYRNVKEKQGR